MKAPAVHVSWGEIIDKVTILEIKAARLERPEALENVKRELALLTPAVDAALKFSAEVSTLKSSLSRVNQALWEVEDNIRERESRRAFDRDFIELARSVYKQNDERAAIKRQINMLLSSELVEEKSYQSY
jgi:3-methyladenine DNA glycosylase/8-oxoguanine DNA glycosylase